MGFINLFHRKNSANKSPKTPHKEVAKTKPKIGKRQVDTGFSNIRVTPLEDAFHLASLLQINLFGRQIGAYILRKGEDSFMIQFGFECKGIHATLRDEEIDPIFDAIESGLKDLPFDERLTIHLGSFTTDDSRQDELETVVKTAPNLELQYLVLSEKARVRQLTRQGVRKPNSFACMEPIQ